MAGQHPGVPGLGDAPFNAGGRRSARRGRVDEDIDGTDAPAGGDDTHGRSLTLASVARDARLDKKFLLLIILSSAIATLGLLQSSAAVVIGAMLVSPLLGPIMGVGFGLATLEGTLIRRSLVTLGAGMAVAVAVVVAVAGLYRLFLLSLLGWLAWFCECAFARVGLVRGWIVRARSLNRSSAMRAPQTTCCRGARRAAGR